MNEVTRILSQIGQGHRSASEELLPLVYDELRILARQRLAREKPGQTLQATALVHEAYLRLIGTADEQTPHWDHRGHFFAAAAEAMRRIIVDNAKRKQTLKRGGERQRLPFDDMAIESPRSHPDILALNEALDRLEKTDPEIAKLVKLRYFAGFTIKEAAEILGISVSTANSHWAFAKAWLLDAIAGQK
jgi:RNA polymerase sigma factor (TIGR02999 family)